MDQAEPKTAEITVQIVSYTKPGKKLGFIKSSEGDFYGAPDADLNKFQKGEVCKIEYTESTGRDGKVWKNLKRKLAGAVAPMPQQRAATNPKDSQQIFVVALLKNMVSENDGFDSVIAKGAMLKRAYERLFGNEQMQNTQNALQDEVPY